MPKHVSKEENERWNTVTVQEARQWLRQNFDEGAAVPCPCCGKTVRPNRVRLSGKMIRLLKNLARLTANKPEKGGYFHLKEIGTDHSGTFSKLKHWNLIYPHPSDRGKWMITEEGYDFLEGRSALQEFAITYNRQMIKFEGSLLRVNELAPSER